MQTKKLTYEQRLFYLLKHVIDECNEKAKKGEMTPEDERLLNAAKSKLLEAIIKYARSLSSSSLENYAKASDYQDDVMQSIVENMIKTLDKYDPLRTTPTTFFRPYIQGAVTKYKRDEIQHLTANDANHVNLVRAAIRKHELRNESWNHEILSKDTGLSIKVVKRTLALMNSATYANIDDCADLKANYPTPEESFLDNEKKRILYESINSELSDFEKEFFYTKINLDDGKELYYTAMAKLYGMGVHEVKKMWNDIITRLATKTDIRLLDPRKSHNNEDKAELEFLNDASDEMIDDMLSEFNDLPDDDSFTT